MKKLKFTKKAIYRLEKEKDVKIGDLSKMGDPGEFKFSVIIDLLWAGQLWERPALTTDQVIEEVDFSNIEEYADVIGEATDEAFGDIFQEEEKDVPKPAGNAGTGG